MVSWFRALLLNRNSHSFDYPSGYEFGKRYTKATVRDWVVPLMIPKG